MSQRHVEFIGPDFTPLALAVGVFLSGMVGGHSSKLLAAETASPSVVVSIKPVHSLVAGVMEGVGTPYLLLKGASSPHHFQLKPSDALRIKRAALIVRVGPMLETPLNKVLSSLSTEAKVLNVMELEGMALLKLRGAHVHHEDGDHDEEHHDDDHQREDHEVAEHHDDDHHDAEDDDHEDHGHEGEQFDPHVWLSIDNAKVMVLGIASRLKVIDEGNATAYDANALKMIAKLEALETDLKTQLHPLKGAHYMAFHDAYQYLTKPLGLKFGGAITLNPSSPPSAKHLLELRNELIHEKIKCVFSEPQYSQKIIHSLVEGSKVKVARLDPIGVKIPAGRQAYLDLMRELGANLKGCLQ